MNVSPNFSLVNTEMIKDFVYLDSNINSNMFLDNPLNSRIGEAVTTRFVQKRRV